MLIQHSHRTALHLAGFFVAVSLVASSIIAVWPAPSVSSTALLPVAKPGTTASDTAATDDNEEPEIVNEESVDFNSDLSVAGLKVASSRAGQAIVSFVAKNADGDEADVPYQIILTTFNGKTITDEVDSLKIGAQNQVTVKRSVKNYPLLRQLAKVTVILDPESVDPEEDSPQIMKLSLERDLVVKNVQVKFDKRKGPTLVVEIKNLGLEVETSYLARVKRANGTTVDIRGKPFTIKTNGTSKTKLSLGAKLRTAITALVILDPANLVTEMDKRNNSVAVPLAADKPKVALVPVNKFSPPGPKLPNGLLNDLTCGDSDGGVEITVAGTTTLKDQAGMIVSQGSDVCFNTSTVREYSCDGQPNVDPQSFVFKDLPCALGSSCQNGACVTSTPRVSSCEDSDGGADFLVSGTTTQRENGKITKTFTDFCYSTTTVSEGYCNEQGLSNQLHKCDPDAQCKQGACVQNRFSCKDTDNGPDYWTAGTTTEFDNLFQKITDRFEDVCISSTTIAEGFCIDNRLVTSTARCASSCQGWPFYNSGAFCKR